ncbi:MAG: type II toxin-antitoxin system PemK/MazF family toxin [Thermoanaerobaculia bacterium]|nr:type II toxin-antitoxin system PemK/MazF family toxin [Thermoanaerobaculia bacterium]
MTSGSPSRGEVWWVEIDKRRPALVVSAPELDFMRARLVAPLTSQLKWERLPRALRLDGRATGLGKPSVVNLHDLQQIYLADFVERVQRLPSRLVGQIDEELRRLLAL